MLLMAEHTNELLLKNHYLRSTSTSTIPKENVGSSKSSNHSRGHGQRQDRDF